MKYIKSILFLFMTVSIVFATGCRAQDGTVVNIDGNTYVKKTYSTAEVVKGSLNPSFTMSLHSEGSKRLDYRINNDELKVESLNVSIGDKVKKGDILVSFQSESLKNTIDSYTNRYEQNLLLIDHYERLMKIDNSADYSEDIKNLQWECDVAKVYIEEAENKLSRFQIVAKENGTITDINDTLINGYCMSNTSLISEVTGTGKYTATVQNDYDFHIGQQYTATSDIISCELKISNVDKQSNSDGKVTQIITFEPISDMSAVSDDEFFEVKVEEPEIKNAVYINKKAVLEDDLGKYVYVLDQNGYRDVVRVETGKVVGDYIIISGLNEGERVTIND